MNFHRTDTGAIAFDLADLVLLAAREGQFTWSDSHNPQRPLGDFLAFRDRNDHWGMPNQAVEAQGTFRFNSLDQWPSWADAPPFAFAVRQGVVTMPEADFRRLSAYLAQTTLAGGQRLFALRSCAWNHPLVRDYSLPP